MNELVTEKVMTTKELADFLKTRRKKMELSIINKKLTMDSRDVAALTHKRHSDVLRDIRNMYEKLGVSKSAFTYKITRHFF